MGNTINSSNNKTIKLNSKDCIGCSLLCYRNIENNKKDTIEYESVINNNNNNNIYNNNNNSIIKNYQINITEEANNILNTIEDQSIRLNENENDKEIEGIFKKNKTHKTCQNKKVHFQDSILEEDEENNNNYNNNLDINNNDNKIKRVPSYQTAKLSDNISQQSFSSIENKEENKKNNYLFNNDSNINNDKNNIFKRNQTHVNIKSGLLKSEKNRLLKKQISFVSMSKVPALEDSYYINAEIVENNTKTNESLLMITKDKKNLFRKFTIKDNFLDDSDMDMASNNLIRKSTKKFKSSHMLKNMFKIFFI